MVDVPTIGIIFLAHYLKIEVGFIFLGSHFKIPKSLKCPK